jgi:hypothetical protein
MTFALTLIDEGERDEGWLRRGEEMAADLRRQADGIEEIVRWWRTPKDERPRLRWPSLQLPSPWGLKSRTRRPCAPSRSPGPAEKTVRPHPYRSGVSHINGFFGALCPPVVLQVYDGTFGVRDLALRADAHVDSERVTGVGYCGRSASHRSGCDFFGVLAGAVPRP